MKRWVALLLTFIILTGCTGKGDEMDRCMALRAKLLACDGCTFDTVVTADYGDEIQTFSLRCEGTSEGKLGFQVLEPESIEGITGRFSGGKGELTFEDVALSFPLLADGQVTPVSAPWILLKTLLGGYLTACTMEDDLLRLTINDSYEDDALQLEIWLDSQDRPIQAEIIYDNRRIITMQVESFEIR